MEVVDAKGLANVPTFNHAGVGSASKGFNPSELMNRLIAPGGELANAVKALQSGQLDKFTAMIPNDAVKAKVNNVVNKIKDVDFTKAASVGRLMNAVYDTDTIFKSVDIGARIGLVSGLVNEAMETGIPNAFKELTYNILDNHQLNEVVSNCLPKAIELADLSTLSDIGDALGKLPSAAAGALNQVSGFVENCVGDVLKNLDVSVAAVRGGISEPLKIAEQAIGVFDKLDSTWRSVSRDGKSVANFSKILKGSKDVTKLLSKYAKEKPTDNKTNDLAYLPAFEFGNVDALLQNQYPTLPFDPNVITLVDVAHNPVTGDGYQNVPTEDYSVRTDDGYITVPVGYLESGKGLENVPTTVVSTTPRKPTGEYSSGLGNIEWEVGLE
jgi:hypothetical protein